MDIPSVTEAITRALGRLILAYRDRHELSRPQLEEKIDLSVPAIQKLEKGQGGFQISSLVKFAALQNVSLPALMKELVTEAGLPADESEPDRELQNVFKNHLSLEAHEVLKKSANKVIEENLNELAWALEVAAELLTLGEHDREEVELAIRRKSPHRTDPKSRARIRELLEKTTFRDL